MQSPGFRILLFSLTFFFSSFISAQNKDRLHHSLELLKTVTNDTLKTSYLDNVGWDTSYDDLAVGLQYCKEALALAEKIKYDKGIIHACNSIGTIYEDMGDVNQALAYHLRGLALAEKTKNKLGETTACMNISIVYTGQQDYKSALKYLLRSKDISESLHDSSGLAYTYNNLGSIYLHFPDSIEKSIASFNKSLSLAHHLKDADQIANCLSGIAKSYQKKGDTINADISMNRAMDLMDSLHNEYSLSQMMVNYASMLSDRGYYARALELLNKSLLIFRKIGMVEQEKELWGGLAIIYEKNGQLQKSIDAWKRFSSMKDSLMNENVMRHQRDLETVYETEKKENEIKQKANEIKHLREVGLEKDKVEAKQKQIVIALVVGCVLLLLFLFLLYNRSQLRKKTNVQLEKQNSIIEEKNKDITDSINYARRIQEAILPAKELKRQLFPESFILFQPRDIVSGDFYWFSEKNGKLLIAAVDCTGHGVPGAFMSMIGNAFLNEIVNEKEITKPAEILNQLRENVVDALKQSDAESENKDGMDIALCSFNSNFSSVEFAGAFNPLWLIRKGELKIFSPDKEPVGFQSATSTPFTNQSINLEKGDTIYIFSDGFADQFGGPKGKKFKYLQLQHALVSIQHQSMSEQENSLLKIFDGWKGNLEQVDDVLVIGIRV
jgi:serine phosphatase RsbU (regulator of sigma subunit)